MQAIKLLNFYKLLSNVATNLVGAFIPLIVLQATGSVALAALLYCSMFLIRIVCSFIFKTQYEKYPQIVLMFRVVTVVLYSFSIILIDSNLWLGVAGATIFYGIDMSLKTVPREILFNYAAANESVGGKSSLGFSRLMEQVGVLLALIVGGVMLDFNKKLIIIISVVIYMIAVIPLVMYYFKGRKQKTFNKDSVSNAQITYEKQPELSKNARNISKKILWAYSIVYFVYCFQDVLGNAFNIHIFLHTSSFGSAGYLNAVYNAFYGIGCYLFSYIDSKKETTPLIIMSCVGCALSVLGLVLFENFVLWYILMGIAGVLYGFICTYMLGRLLPKCRIMGISNSALFYRENASNLSVMCAMILGCTGTMIPVLCSIVVTMAISSCLIPLNEEYTRKDLITYLQNHEKAMSYGGKARNGITPKQEIYEQNPIIDATGKTEGKTSSTKRKTTRVTQKTKDKNEKK